MFLIINKIKKDLDNKYNLISMFRYHDGLINIFVDSPFEWAEIIKESDFVITNLYHGTIFSILFNTPFLSICEGTRKSKLVSLLSDDNKLKRRAIEGVNVLVDKNLNELVETLLYKDNLFDFVENNRKNFNEFVLKIKDICNIND